LICADSIVARQSPADLTPADAEALWTDLVDGNSRRSHRAFSQLAAGGKGAIQVLQTHLRPVPRPDPQLLTDLLADLDKDRFAVRNKASETLATMKNAQHALRVALSGNPMLEKRRRLELILQKLDEIPEDPELPQQILVIHVLEQMGTPEARQFLQAVADGAPGAALTQEAHDALQRMKSGESYD